MPHSSDPVQPPMTCDSTTRNTPSCLSNRRDRIPEVYRTGGTGHPKADWRVSAHPCTPSRKAAVKPKSPAFLRGFGFLTSENRQRFENWKLRRAFALPYFLRSTTRLSRVRKPAAFSGERRLGS